MRSRATTAQYLAPWYVTCSLTGCVGESSRTRGKGWWMHWGENVARRGEEAEQEGPKVGWNVE